MARASSLALAAAAAFLALTGRADAATNVTVALVPNAPWIYYNDYGGTVMWSGIIVDILTQISTQSALPCVNSIDLTCGLNFQFQLFSDWGSQQPDGSWSGAFGSFFNGTTALMPSLPITSGLYDLNISFTGAWSQSDLAFVTIRDKDEKPLLYVLSPLSGQGWAITLGGFALAAFSMAIISKCRPPKPEGSAEAIEEAEEQIGWRDSIFRATLALTGLATVPPSKHSQRLVHLAAFLLFFFVIRAYLARLTAIASVTTYTISTPTWSALTSLPAGTPVGIVSGSAAETWIMSSTAPKIQAVWPYLKRYPTQDAAVAALRGDEIPAMVTESCTARFLALEPPCNPENRILSMIDSTVNIGDVGMGYLHDANYKPLSVSQYVVDTLNLGIATLVETGGFTSIENSYVQNAGSCGIAGEVIEANAIEPKDLGSIMALFGIFVATTLFLVISERRRAGKLKVNGGWKDSTDILSVGPLTVAWEFIQELGALCGIWTHPSQRRARGESSGSNIGASYHAGLSSPRSPPPASLIRAASLREGGMVAAAK